MRALVLGTPRDVEIPSCHMPKPASLCLPLCHTPAHPPHTTQSSASPGRRWGSQTLDIQKAEASDYWQKDVKIQGAGRNQTAVGGEGMPDSRPPLWWAQWPCDSWRDLQTAWHSAVRAGCGEARLQMQMARPWCEGLAGPLAMTANLSWWSPGVLDM